MKFNIKILSIFIFISLVLCLTAVVSAVENSTVKTTGNESSLQTGSVNSNNDANSMDIINDTDLREEIISNLESNGVNTSVLRAAISVGNNNKVKNILDYNKDKLQANPNYVKPEQTEKDSGKEKAVSKPTQRASTPVPTETKSPLSPFTVLIGIGAAGCAVFLLKR